MTTQKEIKELEELCKPIGGYLEKNHNPHCQIVISSDSIKLLSTEMGIPGTIEEILCDGKFNQPQKLQQYKQKANYIARSNIDPIGCVYYCCDKCRFSYESKGFIIEDL